MIVCSENWRKMDTHSGKIYSTLLLFFYFSLFCSFPDYLHLFFRSFYLSTVILAFVLLIPPPLSPSFRCFLSVSLSLILKVFSWQSPASPRFSFPVSPPWPLLYFFFFFHLSVSLAASRDETTWRLSQHKTYMYRTRFSRDSISSLAPVYREIQPPTRFFSPSLFISVSFSVSLSHIVSRANKHSLELSLLLATKCVREISTLMPIIHRPLPTRVSTPIHHTSLLLSHFSMGKYSVYVCTSFRALRYTLQKFRVPQKRTIIVSDVGINGFATRMFNLLCFSPLKRRHRRHSVIN